MTLIIRFGFINCQKQRKGPQNPVIYEAPKALRNAFIGLFFNIVSHHHLKPTFRLDYI